MNGRFVLHDSPRFTYGSYFYAERSTSSSVYLADGGEDLLGFVKDYCIWGQLGWYLPVRSSRTQTLAGRAGNVMICGLGTTECLLAASAENALERDSDHSEARARLHSLMPAASCFSPCWLIAFTVTDQRVCQVWGGEGLCVISRNSANSPGRVLLLFDALEVGICCGFDALGLPPSPTFYYDHLVIATF